MTTASAGPSGAEMDESGWERALKTAMRDSYVVQEVTRACERVSAPSLWLDRDA